MSFFKRALISVSNNTGKSIILFLMILVLGSVVSGTISIGIALQAVTNNVQASLPAMVTIDIDRESRDAYLEISDTSSHNSIVTYDVLHNIGMLPQVKDFDFPVLVDLYGFRLEQYIPLHPSGAEYEKAMSDISPSDYVGLRIKGVQSAIPLDVSEGVIELVQGRMFTGVELEDSATVALISDNFAALNELGIGSIIPLERFAWTEPRELDSFVPRSDIVEDDIAERQSYDLEVIGIYTSLVDFNTGDSDWDWELAIGAENTIYVPGGVAMHVDNWYKGHMGKLHPDNPWYAPENIPDGFYRFQNVYVLHDISDLEAFRQAVAEIAPPFFIVIDPVSNTLSVDSAVEALGELTSTILICAIGAFLLILGLLIALFLRERKREMGVYLALGERRIKVVGQILSEVAIIGLLAITLSLFAGSVFAENISQTMLQNSLAFETMDGMYGGRVHPEDSLTMMGMAPGFIVEEVAAIYDASLNMSTVLAFYAVMVAVIVISTIAPMLYILRLNPRKIMM